MRAFNKGEVVMVLLKNPEWQSEHNKDILTYRLKSFLKDFIDDSPVYQRGLVWTLEQKQAFIIALYEFRTTLEVVTTYLEDDVISDDFSNKWVIIDGKQRLNAIREFLEGEFAVDGYLFKDLPEEEQNFLQYLSIKVTRIYVGNNFAPLTLDDQIRWFLWLNDTGTPVSKEHLAKVRNMV